MKQRSYLLALFALMEVMLVSGAYAADLPAPSGEGIVSPEAKLELLYTSDDTTLNRMTEGPAVAPDGSIYFTDIIFGKYKAFIMRFDPRTKETKPFTNDSGKANGLICASDGTLYACEGPDFGGLRVAAWNLKTGKSRTVTAMFHDKKYNGPNDLCLDAQGRIYFTDPRYMGHEPRQLEHRAVYRVNPDGSGLVEVTHAVEKPNGIALSPDGKTLYVADHNNGTDQIDPTKPAPKQGAMAIYAFALNSEGLVEGERKTLYDFGAMKGCDGMCVDVKGNIYLTQRDPSRPGVLVINPAGKEVAFIPTGAPDQDPKAKLVGIPSNVEFGIGSESKTLYITVDMSLYRIPLLAQGFHIQYQK